MFAKLAMVILTIGAVAATLLAARQQRLYAVHESAQAMRRVAEHDRTLWRLRGEIALRVTPGKVRGMAGKFGPLAYMHMDRSKLNRHRDEQMDEGAVHRASRTQIAPGQAGDPYVDEVMEIADWGDAAATAPTDKEQER